MKRRGTTTHKNKISHTHKQSGTITHSNKKTSLKITNKTKQKGKTTHKKTTFYYLLIEKMKITQKLFAFLDGFTFSDGCETLDAILEYYKIDAPYYSEIARAGEIAETYNEYKRLQNEGQKIDWNILKLL